MTVQAAAGPIAERPPAADVAVGFLWEADDGTRWRSDGAQWWDATAETDPWRLEYAEDLAVGDHVRRFAEVPAATQARGFAAVLVGCPNLHLWEWVIVMERRDAGDVLSCIGVRPNGEQVPLYLGRVELVQVRSEAAPA